MPKELEDWSAQDWLFREYLSKLKQNNVKRIFVITEDMNENQLTFTHNFLSDEYLTESITSSF